MANCYILFSEKLNKYYIGTTSKNVDARIEEHNMNHYGDAKFTSPANDWVLFKSIPCNDLLQARKIEQHIKKMKSKKYILDLNNYPELIQKLKDRFSQN